MQSLKLVVVGDGGVGKSAFLITATTNAFPSEYIPTVFDNYSSNFTIGGLPYTIGLWDTAGQEDYDRLRPLCYPQTDVFLVCFDIGNRASLENIKSKWIPELDHHMPHTPRILVGNKKDLRASPPTESCSGRVRETVTAEEARAVAAQHNMTYLENSALLRDGVQEVLITAVYAVEKEEQARKTRCRCKRFGLFPLKHKCGNTRPSHPQPPVMPPAGVAPWIEVLTSTFAEDWERLLQSDSRCTDVKFVFGDNSHPLQAHKVILSSASPIFREIFIGPKKINGVPRKYQELFKEIDWVLEDHYSNTINEIARDTENELRDTEDESELVRMKLCDSRDVFERILHFLYTGLPGFAEIEDSDFLLEVKTVAENFHLPWLAQVCQNRLDDQTFLNPSIGTWLNDETGATLKKLFLDKPQLCDIRFRVEDHVICAHKAVLMARCDVMAAMLGGAFRESYSTAETHIPDASLDSFLAILEYLYTDHAPIEEGDSIEIMMLADRFCLPRLVTLCELYITKQVDRMIEKKVSDATDEVINLLLASQAHNANQLSKWCLHFIASNYCVFESSVKFGLLRGDNKEYVEEHRWPPLTYLKALEVYEKQVNKNGDPSDRCKVM